MRCNLRNNEYYYAHHEYIQIFVYLYFLTSKITHKLTDRQSTSVIKV